MKVVQNQWKAQNDNNKKTKNIKRAATAENMEQNLI